VYAWVSVGLTDKGIVRGDDHDPTLINKLGEPKYDNNFNPFSSEAMEWLCALCDDIESGGRYGDAASREVGETQTGGVEAVQCPFTQFRDWIWAGTPEASYTISKDSINPRLLESPEMYYKANASSETGIITGCIEGVDGVAPHAPRTWPIEGFWNNWLRWEDWLFADLPSDDPSYERGTSNYAYWINNLYYIEKDNWYNGETPSGEAYPWKCDAYAPQYTPKTFVIEVRTSISGNIPHSDGIELHDTWNDWLDKWLRGDSGLTGTYVPTSDHCDGLEPIDTCEGTDGCSWTSGVCAPSEVEYPGAVPDGVKASFITDKYGLFAYYYLQEKLISECIVGIGLAIFFAFIILNAATKNYIIATVATCVITMIVVNIIGFTVMLGWKLGILESIVYVMVVGMSVDFVVHLGEAYLEAADTHPDRHSRVQDMLLTRGFSILSGAISTLGGIFVLFFAYIQFFFKFAVTIFFLIACSLVFSLMFFTAVMDSFGPTGEFGEWSIVFHDIQAAMDPDNKEFTWYDCCLNCIVPHDSEHRPRVENEEEKET